MAMTSHLEHFHTTLIIVQHASFVQHIILTCSSSRFGQQLLFHPSIKLLIMSALRSKGQKQKGAIKEPTNSEETVIKTSEFESVHEIFTEFMRANLENQLQK